MKALKYAIIVFLSVIAQIYLATALNLRLAAPNLLLILCVLIGFRYGAMRAMFAGFALGLVNDFISFQTFGLSSLGMIFVGLFSGHVRSQMFIEFAILEIVVVLINCVIFSAVVSLTSYYLLDVRYTISFSMIALSSLVAPLFFKVLAKYDRPVL